MPATIKEFFKDKLQKSGLVIARINAVEQQICRATLGRVYQDKEVFGAKLGDFEFIGSGGVWGESSNYSGEVGFVFLNGWQGKIYQASWHGHIPIELHIDGPWCFLCQTKLWALQDVPSIFRENSKPNLKRLSSSTGQPYDTWVKLEALEAFLMEMISEMNDAPCIPIEVADVKEWISILPLR